MSETAWKVAREAAAKVVDPAPNARNGLWAENLRRKAIAIRSLPMPPAFAAAVEAEMGEVVESLVNEAVGMADDEDEKRYVERRLRALLSRIGEGKR